MLGFDCSLSLQRVNKIHPQEMSEGMGEVLSLVSDEMLTLLVILCQSTDKEVFFSDAEEAYSDH